MVKNFTFANIHIYITLTLALDFMIFDCFQSHFFLFNSCNQASKCGISTLCCKSLIFSTSLLHFCCFYISLFKNTSAEGNRIPLPYGVGFSDIFAFKRSRLVVATIFRTFKLPFEQYTNANGALPEIILAGSLFKGSNLISGFITEKGEKEKFGVGHFSLKNEQYVEFI